MGRQLKERVQFRLTTEDLAVVQAAMQGTTETWRGVSHFARQALMNWARGTLSQQRAQAIRQKVEGTGR